MSRPAGDAGAAPSFARLTDHGSEVHLVGDCLAPRTVEEAVLEGLQVGSALR